MDPATLDQRDLIRSLKGTVCPSCGSRKKNHQTLCIGCYRLLPGSLKSSLYDRIGEGYEEAFAKAMDHLSVSQPRWPRA